MRKSGGKAITRAAAAGAYLAMFGRMPRFAGLASEFFAGASRRGRGSPARTPAPGWGVRRGPPGRGYDSRREFMTPAIAMAGFLGGDVGGAGLTDGGMRPG